jgi:16S rRNA (guanine527-N7)-methyltransferase
VSGAAGPAAPFDRALGELAATARAITGREVTPVQHAQFRRYLELLLEWNRAHRLTALASAPEMVRGLFVDSLLFLPLLPPRPCTGVDIGAGAGVPGVPLRIIDPGIRLTLVEARRKKASFLLAVKRELGIGDLTVLEGRAEVLVRQLPDLSGKFDFAVARAAGAPTDVLLVAMGYLRPGGLFVASGPPPSTPLPQIEQPFKGEWRVQTYPEIGSSRTFLVARKES